MDKIEVTDTWLYEQMPAVGDRIITELEKKEKDGIKEFSWEFEVKMRKLIKKQPSRTLKHPGKQIAAAVFLFFLIAFALTMSVDAYRTRFIEIIKTLWGDMNKIQYEMEGDPGKFIAAYPEYIPSGYDLQDEEISEGMVMRFYKNTRDESFHYAQEQLNENTTVYEDNEYQISEDLTIQGQKGEYRERTGDINYRKILWYRGGSSYYIYSEALSKNELLKIAESVAYGNGGSREKGDYE